MWYCSDKRVAPINMKILHVAECAGGVARYLEMLLPLLQGKYKQVFVCSQNFDAGKFQSLADRVYQLKMCQTFSPLRVAKGVLQLRKTIVFERPDIVYCHSSFAGALGRLACMGQGTKVVYNPHGWAFNMQDAGRMKRMFYLTTEWLLSRITDRIVCISGAEYHSAIVNRVCAADKLCMILNGISLSAVEQALPIDRGTLGLSASDYVIGMIGRLVPQKAPDIFMKAGKLIKQKIENAVFIIVGDGVEREWAEDFAVQNNLKLVVTGWVGNPYSYLKIFDVAMLLSRWEGFGLCIAEYMAARKPVIATRVDAIPTLIDHGVDGLLVDVDSPEDVCEKTMYIYNHHKKTEMMKEEAYQKVIRHFDVQRVAAQHVELFTELLGGVAYCNSILLPLTFERDRRRAA